eukprot:TRINITY_DN11877_c0_g1_i5.p1 TRINITY_DN11877_c0_g1~~TRINITY_DN11877_c0_g1_i5.p1  ORF type:complete len:540 (-),score=124.95 TRINITY_DN11877_c0_g1_i5:206-1780(-)
MSENLNLVPNQKRPPQAKTIEYQQTLEEKHENILDKSPRMKNQDPIIINVEEAKETACQQQVHLIKYQRRENNIKSFERTRGEVEEAKQKAKELLFQEQILENKRIEDQLIKDIEDLKNRKIKEMEDLIEIKSKKEQSMKDLDKLKSEMIKNKAFLESLKKINVQQIFSSSTEDKEVLKQTKNKDVHSTVVEDNKPTSPTPVYIQPQSPNIINNHLPDLVNHEKYFRKQNNSESKLAHKNPQHSQENLNHLKKSQELQLYNNQVLLNQEKTYPNLDNKFFNQQHSESMNPFNPSESRAQLPIQNSRQEASMVFPNQNNNGRSFSQAQPRHGNPKEFGGLNHQRSQQATNSSVSLTRVSSTTDKCGVVPGERRKSVENKTAPKLAEGSFIRPRDFSREANLISPSDVGRYVNNLNNQIAVRNFLQNMPNPTNQPHFVQHNQERQTNFSEMQNSIPPSAARRVPQPHYMRTSTQPREAASILSKCAVCSKVANFLCSGCQKVYYCTVQCQSHHWLSHYSKCVAARS